jgi:S1-C subfamily serine protease
MNENNDIFASNNNSTLLISLSNAISDVAAKVSTSIVGIHPTTIEAGIGSGVIWNNDGYIVTCAHIVNKQKKLKVIFSTGETSIANMVGIDPYSDMAVLKLQKPLSAGNLKPIECSESENLKAGQLVFALANPFGDHVSITQGIITSERKSVKTYRYTERTIFDNVVITDARLNPGYSGGPLVDIKGNMIGLDVAYVSSRGIAIRVNKVKSIVDKLIKYGKIKRGYLGILSNTISIPEQISIGQQINQDRGLIILSVEENSPAKKAGLLIGDVILKFDEQPVESMVSLNKLLAEEKIIGKTIDVSLLRGEKLSKVRLTPGEAG